MVKKNSKIAWLLLLPSLVIMLALVFYPIARTFEFSLYEYNLTKPDAIAFIGLDNYLEVFQDSNFHIALKTLCSCRYLSLSFHFSVVYLLLSY